MNQFPQLVVRKDTIDQVELKIRPMNQAIWPRRQMICELVSHPELDIEHMRLDKRYDCLSNKCSPSRFVEVVNTAFSNVENDFGRSVNVKNILFDSCKHVFGFADNVNLTEEDFDQIQEFFEAYKKSGKLKPENSRKKNGVAVKNYIKQEIAPNCTILTVPNAQVIVHSGLRQTRMLKLQVYELQVARKLMEFVFNRLQTVESAPFPNLTDLANMLVLEI
jgi:hypothetical protein